MRWLPNESPKLFPTLENGLAAVDRLKAKVATMSNDTIVGSMDVYGPDIHANAYFSVEDDPSSVAPGPQMTVEIALIALDAMKRAYVLTGVDGTGFWGWLRASGNPAWDQSTLTLGTFSISW